MEFTLQNLFYLLASGFMFFLLVGLIWAIAYVISILRKVEKTASEMHHKMHQIVSILDYLPTHTRLLLAGLTELLSFLKHRSQRIENNKTPKHFLSDSLHKED